MTPGKINKVWHQAHVMPKNPTRAQRVEWHAEHEEACGCRSVPEGLKADVGALKRKGAERPN